MKSISFSCYASLSIRPEELAELIIDTSNWTDFQGYGPLPGIRSAEFELRTPDVIGSRIAVENTDGSRHVEEITEWLPKQRISLRMMEFTPPLSLLATNINETWNFNEENGETNVVRTFQLVPRFLLSFPVVWLISMLLKKAVQKHLKQLLSAQNS